MLTAAGRSTSNSPHANSRCHNMEENGRTSLVSCNCSKRRGRRAGDAFSRPDDNVAADSVLV